MKTLRALISVGVITLAMAFVANCGGSSSPAVPTSLPISVEGLDGASDVPVDSSFQYTFTKAVDTSTVTTSTFFIVATPSSNIAVGPKAALDASICNVANALAASVSCSSVLSCTLDPASDLANSTQYTICLTTDIDYLDGTSFEGYMATFTTVAASSSASCTAPTCSAIHTLILASNSTGVRPSASFTTVTMPEFTCTGGTPTYSMTGLPSGSLAFDASTRALSLASGNTTIASTDATSAISATYTATINSTATSVECTLNDVDGDTIIDHAEYQNSAVPLVAHSVGSILLNTGIKSLYRPTSGSVELIPTGITKTSEGMDLNDSTDASADFDGDDGVSGGGTNTEEITAGTSLFVAATSGTFAAAVSYTTGGNSPESILAGDFDGDGDQDLVTANFDSDSVSILLGAGDGTFGSATSYTTPDKPRAMAIGDVDGDGDLDVITGNETDDNVSVLLNNGSGTLASAVNYSAGDSPRAIGLADFDGDDDLDVVVSNRNGDNISILLGSGSGTFGSATNYTVGDEPNYIAIGDLDDDDDLDIVASNQTGDSISILLGNGSGGFASAVDTSVGDGPRGLTLGDFDGDGDLDLTVAKDSSNNDNDKVGIFLGNGDGTFGTGVEYNVGTDPKTSFAADFDGDGNLDLVVVNRTSDNSSILLGAGDGLFGSATNYSNVAKSEPVTVADFDNDGDLDFAVGNNNFSTPSSTISVFLNQ